MQAAEDKSNHLNRIKVSEVDFKVGDNKRKTTKKKRVREKTVREKMAEQETARERDYQILSDIVGKQHCQG